MLNFFLLDIDAEVFNGSCLSMEPRVGSVDLHILKPNSFQVPNIELLRSIDEDPVLELPVKELLGDSDLCPDVDWRSWEVFVEVVRVVASGRNLKAEGWVEEHGGGSVADGAPVPSYSHVEDARPLVDAGVGPLEQELHHPLVGQRGHSCQESVPSQVELILLFEDWCPSTERIIGKNGQYFFVVFS